MCELAWSSFDRKCNKFEYLWAGFKKKHQVERIHPTQKPVDLYAWILLHYANEGISGSAALKRSLFVSGGELDFAYRFSDPVGLYLELSAPFPYQSSYAQTMFHVGAGLTFYLR